jgi:hypothetical protein
MKCQTEFRVIYALNKALKLYILKSKEIKLKKVLLRERVVVFDLDSNNFDRIHNQRLKNQKGKFTKAPEGNDINTTVKDFWKKGKYSNKIILTQILIPNKIRDECIALLESQKITHGTLFPDYAGTVEICLVELGID